MDSDSSFNNPSFDLIFPVLLNVELTVGASILFGFDCFPISILLSKTGYSFCSFFVFMHITTLSLASG